MGIPEDCGVRGKENEKFEKYQDLAREVRRVWAMAVGVLGTVPLRLIKGYLKDSSRHISCSHPEIGIVRLCKGY